MTEEPAHNVDSEQSSVPPKVTSQLSRLRFNVVKLQTSEKMQVFHVENGIEGAIWSSIQELLLVLLVVIKEHNRFMPTFVIDGLKCLL